MFLDYLYNLPNATSGIDSIATQTVAAVPSFTPLLLLFVFLVTLIGGVMRQSAKIGTADYPMWAVIASLATFMASLIISGVSGLIRLDWLVIVVVVTIFCGVWLFLDRKASEAGAL